MKIFFQQKKVGKRLVVLVILMGAYGFFLHQKEEAKYTDKPLFTLSSKDLLWRFEIGEGDRIIGEIVSVSGMITDISDTSISLNNSVICWIEKKSIQKIFKENDTISLRGRCLGFDNIKKKVQLDYVKILDS